MADALAFLGGIGVVVATTVVTTIVVELIFKPSLEIRKERKLEMDRRRREFVAATRLLHGFVADWLATLDPDEKIARLDERRYDQLSTRAAEWDAIARVAKPHSRKVFTAMRLVKVQILRLRRGTERGEAIVDLGLDAQLLLRLMTTPRWKLWTRIAKQRSSRLNAMKGLLKEDLAFGFVDKVLAAVAAHPPHTFEMKPRPPQNRPLDGAD